ncbi:uncharacterized protein LOC120263058 [Dioscorea cayenensis subsp. rotundata]|uniref:Uncharacterized protein LOC120263058 n=1 Tax=Dioscorea cayennensis subsp. rotundata TaxID=55577 RepID=A0AB40BK05_DIOCR|nr:uncharacterized protein LOC120263058 [Dioscorea cayenensis subsp. rotundata]
MGSFSYGRFGSLTDETGDVDWLYELQHPITKTRSLISTALQAMHAPTITFTIEFICQDMYFPGINHAYAEYLDVESYTIERKEFNKMDMMPFITNKKSAEDALRTMFLNTRTWNNMLIFETCSEKRESMFTEISETIFSFLDRRLNRRVSEIVFNLEVQKFIPIRVDDIPEEFQFLEELEDFDLDGFDEQYDEYNCPAPQALLESMVTEVFHGEEEDMDCVICLEELVSGTEVKRLPCSHCFHGQCIDGWFQGMDKCPICRFTLPA